MDSIKYKDLDPEKQKKVKKILFKHMGRNFLSGCNAAGLMILANLCLMLFLSTFDINKVIFFIMILVVDIYFLGILRKASDRNRALVNEELKVVIKS